MTSVIGHVLIFLAGMFSWGMSVGSAAGDVGIIVGTGLGDLDFSSVFDDFAAVSAIAVNHGTPNTQHK